MSENCAVACVGRCC